MNKKAEGRWATPSTVEGEDPALRPPAPDLVDQVISVATLEEIGAVSPELLAVKRAIEESLRGSAAQQTAGPRSAQEFGGLANIQGVGFGLGTPLSGGDPGRPSLVVFVAEPMTADQVRSLIAEAAGIEVPAGVGIQVERTGLIEPQSSSSPKRGVGLRPT